MSRCSRPLLVLLVALGLAACDGADPLVGTASADGTAASLAADGSGDDLVTADAAAFARALRAVGNENE